ncbi:MAG TPA: hypothetical protein VIY96_05615, partial [Thermoanaerobaculia bacterium]
NRGKELRLLGDSSHRVVVLRGLLWSELKRVEINGSVTRIAIPARSFQMLSEAAARFGVETGTTLVAGWTGWMTESPRGIRRAASSV